MDEDSGSDSGSWASGDHSERLEELEEASICLFCPVTSASCEETFNHMKSNHNVDIIGECQRRNYDCIDYIKLVNFLRKGNTTAESAFLSENVWRVDDTCMKPTVEDDQLLRFGKFHFAF